MREIHTHTLAYSHTHTSLHILTQLSLFFDILLCMTIDIDEEDYVTGRFKKTTGSPKNARNLKSSQGSSSHHSKHLLSRAREMLWKALHGMKMRAGTFVSVGLVSGWVWVLMCVCV